MRKKDFISLYEKFLDGNCTDEEIRVLEEHRDEFTLNEIPWNDETHGIESEFKKRVYKRLLKSISSEKRTFTIQFYRLTAAAAILIVLGTTLYLNKRQTAPVQHTLQLVKSIAPGGRNKAVLTLANGHRVVLEENKKTIVPKQGNSTITNDENNRLTYNGGSTAVASNTNLVYNSITVPQGSEYQVVLSDGTKVWLNSSSTLHFPVSFASNERRIELTGEAYFEVAKNKSKPFRVIVNQETVEVLGTHFNINAYKNEVVTTLLEGLVRLKNQTKQVILSPGQSGTSSESGIIKVENSDLEEAVGWKSGYFVFHNETIKDIIEQLERWYAIKVEFKNHSENIKLYGKISKYETLETVLKNLEFTGTVHFKIDEAEGTAKERRITIMP